MKLRENAQLLLQGIQGSKFCRNNFIVYGTSGKWASH